jgi:hypothetical protein
MANAMRSKDRANGRHALVERRLRRELGTFIGGDGARHGCVGGEENASAPLCDTRRLRSKSRMRMRVMLEWNEYHRCSKNER